MALNTRSIEHTLQKKGRPLLAFFLAACCGLSLAETTAFVDGQHNGSAGLASANHWLKEGLQANARTNWINYHLDTGISHRLHGWQVSLADTRQGYLQANDNAIFLAAQNDAKQPLDLSTVGQFALMANIWTLHATKLSANVNFSPSERLAVSITPHLLQVHDYQHSTGKFNLLNFNKESLLNGTLTRTGTRNYGFLVNDQVDAGWGIGVHLRGALKTDAGDLHFQMENMFNRLHFQTIHQSVREYKVTATSGAINIADQPSVSGRYGYTSLTEQLPKIWQLNFKPNSFKGVTAGITGQDREARLAMSFQQSWSNGQWWLRSVAAQNWSVGTDWNIHPCIRAGFGITTAKSGASPNLSNFYLIGQW